MSLLPHQIDPKSANGRLWNEVAKTYPSQTKRVNSGGRSFTAIDAYAQIKRATEVFGPVGIGWGWEVKSLQHFGQSPHDVVHATVEVWYIEPEIDDDSPFGSQERRGVFTSVGCAQMTMQPKGKDYVRVDADAGKKATTDAITKALSFIGFNVDVFFGAFDSNKYVEEMEREEREQRSGASHVDRRKEEPQAEPANRTEKDSEGPPAPGWFSEEVGGDGRFSKRTWGWMSQGGIDGGRHKYLRVLFTNYRSEKLLKRIAWILAKFYDDHEAATGKLKSGLDDPGAGHAEGS